ncbi:uncharacterized protein KY384_004920 [Bacidia gigantensis]|uniref:uncharacterized protein n=1 Tax=Bacidia gigantensis TaxID=2732470 RepID=UPI001D03BB44|nr:uncharacterized protein KY384_004920 [Bacidia gigantensis]KAG8530418.1 hypothetical protein KY384_004920 [Bacidia gigantensis]
MSSADLSSYVKSDLDFYDLLGVSYESSQKELDRAWRKTALKYHPDKVGDNEAAKEKFHLANIAYELLSDPSWKDTYNNARNAKLQRQRQNELFEGRRRQMKDDLEARERGVKRPRDEEDDEEKKLEREIRRLAEDGKRRRQEREDTLRREMREEEEQKHAAAELILQNLKTSTPTLGQSDVSEIDRTIKVRWPIEGKGGDMTAESVKKLFSEFGPIESADLLNPKMLRLTGAKKKEMALTCMIQYRSVVDAHAAVEDFPAQYGEEWQLYRSVQWAANKEPDIISGSTWNGVSSHAPSTPQRPTTTTPSKDSKRFDSPTTSVKLPHENGNPLNKKPSFASFSATSTGTPKNSPFGKGLGSNSPSLEEMTIIRLRKLEQKRLAAEIEREDERADAAPKVNGNGNGNGNA